VGVTRRLRELNPRLKAIAVQPESPLHGLEGLKHMATAITPGIFDETLVTETLEVATEDALLMTSKLARQAGLLVGPSSGANVFAAWRVAAALREPAVVVTVLCDGGERYLND
jgi:cysteine synthase B